MYDNTQMDVNHTMGATVVSAVTSAAAVIGRLLIGYKPLKVRAIWATIITAPTVTNAVITFKFRPTPGSATAEVVIGTITLPVAAAIGKQYYKKSLDYQAQPGGEIVAEVTTTSTAGAAACGVFAEPVWANPSDNAAQVASA